MSDTVSTMYGRADLSQDVANIIEELGMNNYVQALREFFPCRDMHPREYAKHNLVKRKVKFVYVGVNEPVPTVCPDGYDLLVVNGVVFSRRETEDIVEHLEKAQTGDRVLVGVPLHTMTTIQQLRELNALRELAKQERYEEGTPSFSSLVTRRSFVHKQLVDRARRALAPSSFRWIYKGEVVEDQPAGTRNMFISGFLRTIYSSAPRITLGSSKSEAIAALDEMLDLTEPLQISTLRHKGAAKVLRRIMVESTLLKPDVDNGSYVSYKLADYVTDTTWARIWKCCTEIVVGDGRNMRTVELSELVNALSAAPWGLSIPVQALLLAVIMRRTYPDINVCLDGEPMTLSGRALMRAFSSPRGWTINYKPASQHEIAFLDKVAEIFSIGNTSIAVGFANIWEATLRGLLAWLQSVPGIAKLHRETMSEDTRKFMELVTNREKGVNPNEFFSEYLPSLCGENGIPLEGEQEAMLEWLKQRRHELVGRSQTFRNDLCRQLAEVLGAEGDENANAQWLDGVYCDWLNRLHAGTEGYKGSKTAAVLRGAEFEGDDPEDRWFEIIPQKLGLPALNAWNRDLSALYKARLAKARVELETWNLREVMPWPGDTAEGRQVLARWLVGMFEGLHLSKPECESVLLDMIEENC